MRIEDLDYDLPEELIAQRPAARREEARLLVVPKAGGDAQHARIADLPALLAERLPRGALIVLNDTRVRAARLRGRKAESGGAVELLLLSRSPADDVGGGEAWRCLVGSSKPLRAGAEILLEGDRPPRARALTEARQGEALVLLDPPAGDTLMAALARAGEVPLPPYIHRERPVRIDSDDAARYQTVYARHDGAVAAPTAGLHFTPDLLASLDAAGFPHAFITLHVGRGTFEPIREEAREAVERHALHAETYEISGATATALGRAREEGRAVLAVGTTSTRALETYGATGAARGETSLYLVPGHRFLLVDALLTNFHLPRTTLLLLVYALLGRERTLAAYSEAVRARYRFYSFGDAMLVV